MKPIVVALLALFVAAPAIAHDSDGLQIVDAKDPENLSLAEKHFDDAVVFFRAGKYELARVEFEASYAITRPTSCIT